MYLGDFVTSSDIRERQGENVGQVVSKDLLPKGYKVYINYHCKDGYNYTVVSICCDTPVGKGTQVCTFYISGLLGNCGIAEFSSLQYSDHGQENLKHKGSIFAEIACRLAKRFGYTIVECTTNHRQEKFAKIITEYCGFKELYRFINKRTNNRCRKFYKEL